MLTLLILASSTKMLIVFLQSLPTNKINFNKVVTLLLCPYPNFSLYEVLSTHSIERGKNGWDRNWLNIYRILSSPYKLNATLIVVKEPFSFKSTLKSFTQGPISPA